MSSGASGPTTGAARPPGRGRRRSLAGRVRALLDRVMRHPVTGGVVMAAILASVALLLAEMYLPGPPEVLGALELAGYGFTALFIVELGVRWYVAPSSRRFWREYWLDALAVIPFFRPLRILRVLRLLRLYRFGVLAQRFVPGRDASTFERAMREEIARYHGKFADQVWHTPEFFRLLTNLLEDGRVPASARARIVAALAYFITPFEALPRETHGAEGYLDQLAVCLETVLALREDLPEWLIEEAWEGEGNVWELMEEELPVVRAALDPDALQAARRYLGLPSPPPSPTERRSNAAASPG